MIQPYVAPACTHSFNMHDEYAHERAKVNKGELDIYLGGTDYYANDGTMPIKFCPFCGIKVEDISE